MKNKTLLLLALLLLISCIKTEAQTYYKIDKGDVILTKTEYDNHKKELIDALKLKYEEVKINEILTDSRSSKDSIIKTYELDIRCKTKKEANKHSKEKIYSYLNKKLPYQILHTIDDKEISLDDFKGKPIVINFWFATCKPCIEEMPVLNKLMGKYSDKVHFISITHKSKETVKRFLTKHKFDYLTVVGANKFVYQIGINGFPRNIFIDKNGIVKKIKYGIPYYKKDGKTTLGTGETFEKYIEELL